MDIKRLRIGTKVKVLVEGAYRKVGEVGHLAKAAGFHDETDKVTDGEGYYWIKFPDRICMSITLDPTHFKVLKY